MKSEDSQEAVIRQIKEAYVEGKIDLDRLESDVEATLKDFVIMGGDGWPVYYDAEALEAYAGL